MLSCIYVMTSWTLVPRTRTWLLMLEYRTFVASEATCLPESTNTSANAPVQPASASPEGRSPKSRVATSEAWSVSSYTGRSSSVLPFTKTCRVISWLLACSKLSWFVYSYRGLYSYSDFQGFFEFSNGKTSNKKSSLWPGRSYNVVILTLFQQSVYDEYETKKHKVSRNAV